MAAKNTPKSELAIILASYRGWWWGLFVFSGVINLLTLTGSMFMLQVYDRVLTSRSLPTLVALLIITIILYAIQGALEVIRGRLLLRMGSHFEETMGKRIFGLVQLWPLRGAPSGDGLQPIRDLDSVRSFLSERGVAAILDLPWIPVFLIFVFILHPWLGLLTLAGAVALSALAYAAEIMSRRPMREVVHEASRRQSLSLSGRRNAEVLRAMGFGERYSDMWLTSSEGLRGAQEQAGDISSTLGAIARTARSTLQALTLALGAYLVIQGEVSSGVIIASSITAARALAPIDTAIAYWKMFVTARDSHARLEEFLKAMPPEPARMSMPAPTRELKLEGLHARPPGTKTATVRGVSFKLTAGQGLGIVGVSGGGKSTLVRALVGVWPIMAGTVRLDGAPLAQWDLKELGRHVGYLPQDVQLFAGTIAENIARFELSPDSTKIIDAAKNAGVHEMILNLSKGYETRLGEDGQGLSGGQRQRIGLARALYGDPFLVVLDEPNSSLDATGEAAVTRAVKGVRDRGGIVVIVAHRPSVLAAVDILAEMEGGVLKAFGSKEELMRKAAQAKGAVPMAKPPRPSAPPPFVRPQPAAAKADAAAATKARPALTTLDLKATPTRPARPALLPPSRPAATARPEKGATAKTVEAKATDARTGPFDDPLTRLANSFNREDKTLDPRRLIAPLRDPSPRPEPAKETSGDVLEATVNAPSSTEKR